MEFSHVLQAADASCVIFPISRSPFGLIGNLKILQGEFLFIGFRTKNENKRHGHVF